MVDEFKNTNDVRKVLRDSTDGRALVQTGEELPDGSNSGHVVVKNGTTDPVNTSPGALDHDSDSITTVEEETTTFGHGVATVDAAGTDEPISATPLLVKWVIFQAIPEQAGKIALGGAGVDATATTGTGILLDEGDSVPFGPCDLADIYQDATITGNGVRYTYGV